MSKAKTQMEDFFTAESSENGVKLELIKPNGDSTEHYLIVKGVDSTDYRLAVTKALREAREEVVSLKIKKFIQLGLLLVTVIGAGAKAWFEIDQSKQRDLMLEKRLEAYKTDADKKIEAYKASTDKKIEVMKDNFALRRLVSS